MQCVAHVVSSDDTFLSHLLLSHSQIPYENKECKAADNAFQVYVLNRIMKYLTKPQESRERERECKCGKRNEASNYFEQFVHNIDNTD